MAEDMKPAACASAVKVSGFFALIIRASRSLTRLAWILFICLSVSVCLYVPLCVSLSACQGKWTIDAMLELCAHRPGDHSDHSHSDNCDSDSDGPMSPEAAAICANSAPPSFRWVRVGID